jgi:hypothetical protein
VLTPMEFLKRWSVFLVGLLQQIYLLI